MQTSLKLLLIVFAAPALAHVLAEVLLFAPLLVFTAPVSYPLRVLVTGATLPSLHAVFLHRTQGAAPQLPIVLVVCVVFGVAGYLLLSWTLDFSAMLAAWYAAFGIANGVICWGLYNWGPLRVRRSVLAGQKGAPRDVAF
jgi:hypothetical protein